MKPLLRPTLYLLFILLAGNTESYAQETIEDQLERFHSSPIEFYFEHTPKFDIHGEEVYEPNSFLEHAGVGENDFIEYKLHQRDLIGRGTVQPERRMYSPILPGDRPEGLADNGDRLVRNMVQLEEMGLRQAALDAKPWSGDYWPLYKGALGFRFLDVNFPVSEDWALLFKYISDFPFLKIFQSGNQSRIQSLSPSEKYDLLVGDLQGTLTQNMWGQGKEYYDSYGKVETWMGICHGWAAAAVNVGRPQKQVQLVAYDGKTEISMNPSEIKGLVSYLWANTPYKTRFVGGRCNLKDVPRDPNGRPLDPTCLDTNPGTWHLAVMNQIGIAKRSFVMDATADYEVWNQPVYSYKTKYFNPITRKEVATWAEGLVRRDEFKEDRFMDYRSQKTVYLVGVEMEVYYISEESANDRAEDSEDYDSVRRVRYLYDLELDMEKNIIGGEWYRNEHPDFLWVPHKGTKPLTYEDQHLAGTDWNSAEPMPQNWKEAARWASQSGRVLSSVVDVIWTASKKD